MLPGKTLAALLLAIFSLPPLASGCAGEGPGGKSAALAGETGLKRKELHRPL